MQLKYIMVPVYLFKGLFENKNECLRRIFFVGVFQLSKKIRLNELDVAKQILYILYREDGFNNLKQTINKLCFEMVGQDTDYYFAKGMYEEDFFSEELNELVSAFQKNIAFRELCFHCVSVRAVLKSFNVLYDVEFLITEATQIETAITIGLPSVGINMNLILEFINEPKTQSELTEFSAFHAIKSILGKKKMFKTNMALILARMYGFARVSDIDQTTHNHPLYQRLLKRYHRDKLFQSLEINWYVKKLSKNNRGFLIAIGDKTSYDEMAIFLNDTKLKRQIEELKNKKRIAFQKANIVTIVQTELQQANNTLNNIPSNNIPEIRC